MIISLITVTVSLPAREQRESRGHSSGRAGEHFTSSSFYPSGRLFIFWRRWELLPIKTLLISQNPWELLPHQLTVRWMPHELAWNTAEVLTCQRSATGVYIDCNHNFSVTLSLLCFLSTDQVQSNNFKSAVDFKKFPITLSPVTNSLGNSSQRVRGEVGKHNVNQTLMYYLVFAHFCLSRSQKISSDMEAV